MFVSVFDIFKIGVGPSSSHTMGPMIAANRFLDELRGTSAKFSSKNRQPSRIRVSLHGSLAFTGKGHATDRAIILGLAGCEPQTHDPETSDAIISKIASDRFVDVAPMLRLAFDPQNDLVFDLDRDLPGHANGMVLCVYDDDDAELFKQTYYSIGGGFVVTEDELNNSANGTDDHRVGESPDYPFPFISAKQMLKMGGESGLSIAEMKRANEVAHSGECDLGTRIDFIWQAMDDCISRGLRMEGELPGGLKVKRRAKQIYDQLLTERGANQAQPHRIGDWISIYAIAVNEENASGGRIATAPTNGAAGVVPAVIKYYLCHCTGAKLEKIREFLLTAAAIGGLIKHNASISGAEVGCQGEIGSASAMAAAGLCAVLNCKSMHLI